MPPAADDAPQVRQLKALLGQAKLALAAKDAELRAAVAQRSILRAQLAERAEQPKSADSAVCDGEQPAPRAELQVESSRLAALQQELDAVRADLEGKNQRIRELEALLQTRDQKIRGLERDLAEGLAWSDASGDDDLKQIRGIGPSFERTLKELGVRKLTQIAGWSSEDIQRVAGQLRTRPERIVRDGWVECAKRLTGASG